MILVPKSNEMKNAHIIMPSKVQSTKSNQIDISSVTTKINKTSRKEQLWCSFPNFTVTGVKREVGLLEIPDVTQIFYNRIPKSGSLTTKDLLHKINCLDVNKRLQFLKISPNLATIYNNETDKSSGKQTELQKVSAMEHSETPWMFSPHFQYFDFKNTSASFRNSTYITGKSIIDKTRIQINSLELLFIKIDKINNQKIWAGWRPCL